MVDGWAFLQEWVYGVHEYFAFDSGLARDRPLVRFDRRGVGGSQRAVDDVSLDAQVADVHAVVQHLEFREFDLNAGADGTPVAIAYASTYPHAVRRLVLWTPYARTGDVFDHDQVHRLAELMRSDWSLARRTYASFMYSGSAALEAHRSHSIALREGVAPELAARYLELELDVHAMLPLVRCPTLILQARTAIPAAARAAREIADRIPGARRVMTRGDDSLQDWQEQLAVVRRFLGDGPAAEDKPAAAVTTVLFTDIVGHTEMLRRLGDQRGRELLREHERITRTVLAQHGGVELKSLGDGFMASFSSVVSAIDCAVALQRAFAAWNEERRAGGAPSLLVRVGLNAGEPIAEDGDLFGASVIMASRIAAIAGAGEILIPEPLRHLLTGKDYAFADRGETVLKGFQDPLRLYEVRWQE
jgi:class 3 adenylate cyclase